VKTKLGISVGLLGATAYFLGLFAGWLPVLLVAGYVLLFESNEWLRKSAIKAVAICIFFAVLSAIIGFVPNAIKLIDDACRIFKGSFSIAVVSKIIDLTNTVLMVVEKILLLVLGFKALRQGTISFGVVDRLVAKHTQRDDG